MAKIISKRRANVKIRKCILMLVFSIEFEVWNVIECNIRIALIIFIVPNILNKCLFGYSGFATRARCNLR